MAKKVGIGSQDFEKVRVNNNFYIDKTNFIREWWESGDEVTLITRPRRFGKTLNMSMLEKFFSIQYANRGDLFEGLSIWKEKSPNGEYKYGKIQGTYPVLFISFAGIKENSFEGARENICRTIEEQYNKHDYLLDSGLLNEKEKNFYQKVSAEMSDSIAAGSLRYLSDFLSRYYGKKIIILLDEYDTPMQEAYSNGYWDQLVAFMRKFMNETFKTNPYLERGLMTGITRVSKESVFSDLNHPVVITTATTMYETAFGFTENEVFQALTEYHLQDKAEEAKRWYDGFRFGDCSHMYNPWSVINYLKYKRFAPYWANTSSNTLVGKLIQESNREIKMIVEELLKGKSFKAVIDEQVVFDQLENDSNALWSFLLASGYLKIVRFHDAGSYLGEEFVAYELELTNIEAVTVFRKMIHGWFGKYQMPYNDFIKAMLLHDLKNMNLYMNKVALTTISFFDTGTKMSKESEPERFYHGLMLGLMVDLNDKYEITSNRESGFGKYDVLFQPHHDTDDGIILEFKVIDQEKEKSLKDTAQAAIKQIVDKKYAEAFGANYSSDRIRIYGFAFKGKEVWIDGGYLCEYENP